MDWLTPSLPVAERLFSLSNVGLIVGLVLTAVCTVGAVWMANVKEGYLNRELADAKARGEEAKAEAAKANELAALNLEAANKAQRELEIERTERLRLQARVAPRNFGPDQQQALADAVKGFSGKVVAIQFYAQDAEAALLAQQIVAGLRTGGIEVRPNLASVMPLGGFVMGVLVSGKDQELTSLIANTLAQAGDLVVGLDNKPSGPSETGASSAAAAPDASILVGVKPVRKIDE
jgi:hypothetical protein